eukprot:Em0009g1160a
MGAKPSVTQVDLTGRVALVTGGNTGIGYETSKALALMGAHVIIACRSEQRATEALHRMREEVTRESPAKQINVEYMQLDLGSFESTKKFVSDFKGKGLRLHILINNAGIMAVPFGKTADGYEMHFQVNHLSHFLMTLELLPLITETASVSGDGRIVLVSSLWHNQGTFDPANMNGEVSYGRVKFYGNSKLYNVMMAYALQRRLGGANITVSSLHPGAVDTELTRGSQDLKLLMPFVNAVKAIAFRTPLHGAFSSLNCAVNPALNTQQAFYYSEDGAPIQPTEIARNEAYQEQLWELSINAVRSYLSPETLERYGQARQQGGLVAASLLSQEAVPVTIGVEGPQITEAQSKDSGASPHLTEGSTVAQTKDSENDVPSTEAGKIAV